MGLIDMIGFSGIKAVGVIDFNATGTAAMSITIGGVTYQEADVADVENGVWTNGASAANSATSLAAAINGDTRSNKPAVTAAVSSVGDTVVVVANREGTAGNLAITSSAGTATVENMHGGDDPERKNISLLNYVVTAQDILADQCNIGIAFTPTSWAVELRSGAGQTKGWTGDAKVKTAPLRFQLNFGGATDPVAGDVFHLLLSE